MFALSAIAVDKEIVGNDNDGELIWGEEELRKACCCARSAVVAVWPSTFDFGVVKKNCDSLFDLEAEGRRGISVFSLRGGEELAMELVGEPFINGICGIRGILKRLSMTRSQQDGDTKQHQINFVIF